jgi:choloylglycine hydrolase
MKKQKIFAAIVVSLLFKPSISDACTGISLKAADQTVVVARTVEWALGDAQHNKVLVVPRNKEFKAQTPMGLNGKSWK